MLHYAAFHLGLHCLIKYRRTCLKRPFKKNTKIGFQDRLSLNAGQKYCRMLQGEHSAILTTLIKLPFSIKTFVLYIFEWPLKTGFTVSHLGVSSLRRANTKQIDKKKLI